MTLTKSILFFAIFSNMNCIWQRGTGLAPGFQDQRLFSMILDNMLFSMNRHQNPMDITEKLEPNEHEKKNEDHWIRLLRKRAEATKGRIRIL